MLDILRWALRWLSAPTPPTIAATVYGPSPDAGVTGPNPDATLGGD